MNHIGWLVCEWMEMPPSQQLRFWAHELGGMAKTGLLHAHAASPAFDADGRAVLIPHETLDVRLVDPADPPSDMSSLRRTMLRDAATPGPVAVFQ